jgi:thymidylate kinase
MAMRLIVIGCEYAGKTTLIDGLDAWGQARGLTYHLDDHFSIPDQYFLSPEEQRAMVALPPTIKERFQRFQIYYHVGNVLHEYEDALLGGFHIEEAIYGGRYNYPGHAWPAYQRKVESDLPADTILLLLKASPEVIRRRMELAPHKYPVVKPEDVEAVSKEFEAEYRASWIARKLAIDTSDLTPDQLLSTFMKRVVPFLDTRDLLRFSAVQR